MIRPEAAGNGAAACESFGVGSGPGPDPTGSPGNLRAFKLQREPGNLLRTQTESCCPDKILLKMTAAGASCRGRDLLNDPFCCPQLARVLNVARLLTECLCPAILPGNSRCRCIASLIYLFGKHVLSICCVPGTVRGLVAMRLSETQLPGMCLLLSLMLFLKLCVPSFIFSSSLSKTR